MKLLFNYLKHSMKEGDSGVESKSTPNKSNGGSSRSNKCDGNIKNNKAKSSMSSTDMKLDKFFSSFKVSHGPVTNGDADTLAVKKQQCNSQIDDASKKRSNITSTISSPGSIRSNKSPRTPSKKKTTPLSTSASNSAKKRAIERVLKKKDPSSATKAKRRLNLNDIDKKNKKSKPRVEESSGDDFEVDYTESQQTKSSGSKRSRKRSDSGSSDDSSKTRPRRRASQTYFFKYQLARNPLKAEEEDLKQALLASLEQCSQQNSTSSKKQQQILNNLLSHDQSSNTSTNSKTIKLNRENRQKQPRKQNPKRPPNNKHSKTSSLSIAKTMMPVTPATIATSTPPTYDEEYLERYRPDTEDFLTFICFRVTAPNLPARQNATLERSSTELTANSRDNLTNGCANNHTNSSIITGSLNIKIDPNIMGDGIAAASSSTSSSMLNDHNHTILRRSVSPYKMNSNSTPTLASNQLGSPMSNRRRPPTRQSPRLANNTQQQQQKISDFAPNNNFNRAQVYNTTAFNPIIDYQEDLKRASMALEDMAQEITRSNGLDSPTTATNSTKLQNGKTQYSQNLLLSTADAVDQQQTNSNYHSKTAQTSPYNVTTLPFKSNKHLVKGLMTREFAGTFADEEIIFESISNHKL